MLKDLKINGYITSYNAKQNMTYMTTKTVIARLKKMIKIAY